MSEQSMRDRITWLIAVTICAFMLLSLIGSFALEFTGRESGTIWGRIFDLVNVLAGVVAGYIAGQQIQSTRDKREMEKLRKKARSSEPHVVSIEETPEEDNR